MKKKIISIKLKKGTSEYKYPTLGNYKHFEPVTGGIYLYGNKVFKIPNCFMKMDDIDFITFY